MDRTSSQSARVMSPTEEVASPPPSINASSRKERERASISSPSTCCAMSRSFLSRRVRLSSRRSAAHPSDLKALHTRRTWCEDVGEASELSVERQFGWTRGIRRRESSWREESLIIQVQLGGDQVPIQRAVFSALLDNSVAGTYAAYPKALATETISFLELLRLARIGEIPYPLFFADLPTAEAQVAAKTQKLLAGVSKETFSLGSRAPVDLRDVELILKDLIRKQEALKRHDGTLSKNRIIGLLRKPGPSVEQDARKLAEQIGTTHDVIRACRTKELALELIIERLESHQVLVSRSVQNFMPQRLTHVDFSGMTIRDAKVPYIFLAGGDHGDHQEPVGRTIFTLTLMAVLVARRVFSPVTWNAESTASDLGREYDIAGAMLMPERAVRLLDLSSRESFVSAASEFKVTPSAVVIRTLRLGLLSASSAENRLAEFREEFLRRPERTGMSPIRPENAVRKYAGREMSRRMIEALDCGALTTKEFHRVVCLNKLGQSHLDDLRRAGQMSGFGVKYLVDTNALSQLGRRRRASEFFRGNAMSPSEVLYEADGFPDVEELGQFEYHTTASVLQWLTTVMATVSPTDVNLINLYLNRGGADPLMIACALDARDRESSYLDPMEWVVVSNDKAVTKLASQFEVRSLSYSQFAGLIDD